MYEVKGIQTKSPEFSGITSVFGNSSRMPLTIGIYQFLTLFVLFCTNIINSRSNGVIQKRLFTETHNLSSFEYNILKFLYNLEFNEE